RGRGRLRGRRDAPLAPAPAPGPGRARAAGRSAVTGPPSGNPRGFERVSRDVWRSVGMPTQVLFIQGAGAAAHDAWDDKRVRSLERELGDGYMVLYPRMPDEAAPHYASWKAALLNELEKLRDGAILIGHPLGGAFLIHALAEHPPKRRPGAISL